MYSMCTGNLKSFECLLTAMAYIQSVDRMEFFFFLLVGGVNAHHEECLRSTHGRATCDVASSTGCEQIVTEPTHIKRGALNLAMTDVSDLVGVRVGSPVRTSDHSAVFLNVEFELPAFI